MGVLETAIDPNSASYAENRAAMLERLAELDSALEAACGGGGEKYVTRHHARGKLLPRERIELLVDRDSPFLELSPVAAWGTDFPTGASVVTGIGVIEGVECVLVANDPTVRGGAINPYSLRKTRRAGEIALTNRLPMINLVESAGADLPTQSEIFIPGGAVFRDLTRLSAGRIPTVSVVFGNATAGGAYVPGLSDYTIMVRNQAKVFLAGPPLVKMATGEITDDESLGGAAMHVGRSGLADYLAEDEHDGIRLARRCIRRLNWRKQGPPPGNPAPAPPKHDVQDLLAIPGTHPGGGGARQGRAGGESQGGGAWQGRAGGQGGGAWQGRAGGESQGGGAWQGRAGGALQAPFDPREVLGRVLDGSDFDEFKPGYGTALVTGWGELHGYPVGVLANARGVLFSAEAQKAAQFIQLANASDTPLVFLQNTTGYMVGTEYEQRGIIKHGALMINAVSNSTVPHLTINLGASYGAGNYGMCGRAFQPRFLFSWPNAKSAVMGPAQLAGVLSIIARQAAEAKGQIYDDDSDSVMRAMVEQQIESESAALFLSGKLYDDGVIDPRDTRTVLGLCLSAIHSGPISGAAGYGVFRM